MPTIIGILIFMSMINFMRSWVEHDCFYNFSIWSISFLDQQLSKGLTILVLKEQNDHDMPGYKRNFILNSLEHEISTSHKNSNVVKKNLLNNSQMLYFNC